MAKQYDGIVIGAGHNGLVTSALLARRGLKILVLEAKKLAGGGLATFEDPNQPGFFHNPHSFFHRGIPQMPWFKELELEKHGVKYIDNDLYVSILQRSGAVLNWWTDFEKTYESFAAVSRDDADTLRSWRSRFIPVVRDILKAEAVSAPLPAKVRQSQLEKTPEGRLLLDVSALSPLEFVMREFKHPGIQGGLLFINGMREVDLRAKGFGHHLVSLFATSSQVQTCEGGAISLANALVNALQAHGGDLRLDAPVEKILSRGNRVTGVQLRSGEHISASKFVASGVNPQMTFLDMLDAKQVPEGLQKKASGFKYNTLGPLFSLHLNLDKPPVYSASDKHPEVQSALSVIMGIDDANGFLKLVRAHDDQQVSAEPILWGSTPTLFDPSQAPRGKHTAFMWEKTPYALQGDPENWRVRKTEHAERMLTAWEEFAPGLRGTIISQFAQTPQEVPIDNPNMREADVLMGALTHGQIGIDRPFPGMGNYRTHLDGLYLVGSSCHPGGNITGLPGHNAAVEIRKDLGV